MTKFIPNRLYRNAKHMTVDFFAQTAQPSEEGTRLHGLWLMRDNHRLLVEDTVFISAHQYNDWNEVKNESA